MRRRPSKRRDEAPSADFTAEGSGSGAAGRDPSDPAAARNRALRLLTRREHGAHELKRKLVARGVAPEQAAATVETLAQAGWQSDARFVESMIRQRVAQGYGPLRVHAELEDAGVADALVREALAVAAPDWKALAIELHQRRFGEAPTRAADWQKQYRFLAARGFDPQQIRAALKHAPDEDEAF